MKTYPASFGFEAFLIYFIPGSVVMVSILVVALNPEACGYFLSDDLCTTVRKTLLGEHLENTELTMFTIGIILSGFFGCIVAVIANYMEMHCLDRTAAHRIWKEYKSFFPEEELDEPGQRKLFTDIWYWYIANLGELKNSYITLLRLHFTSRIGISAFVLAFSFLLIQQFRMSFLVFIIGVLLRKGASEAGYALGVFRFILYLKANDFEKYCSVVRDKRDKSEIFRSVESS